MANKTAKRKKRYHKSTLPVADKIVYWILFVLIFVVVIALLLGQLFLRRYIAFSAPDVVAVRDRASLLLALPSLLAIFLGVFIPCVSCYQKNQPIFGRQWLKRKAKFAPNKPFCTEKSNPEFLAKKAKQKRKERWRKSLLCILLGSLMVPALFSFWSRDALQNDGSLKRYNILNSLCREYDSKEIVSVELDCQLIIKGTYSRYNLSKKVEVFMTFTYNDGRRYSFRTSDFQGDWLLQMTALKEQLDPSMLSYHSTEQLPRLIRERKMDAAETTVLYALFDIQK